MDIIKKYKDWLLVNGCAYATIRDYSQRIRDFLKEVKLEEINEENLQAFLLKLKEKSKPATVNAYRYAISSFLTYIKKDIPLPKQLKVIQKLPEYMTLKYFENNVIPMVELNFKNYIKIKVLFYFWYFTGLRISEIPLLKRKNFDLESRTAKIIVKKTREERIIIYTEKVKELLEMYFGIEPEVKNAFNIYYHNINHIIKKLKPYLPEINFRPHLFRHSFAIHLLSSGVDIRTVQQLLGHKSIQSTLRYLNLDTTKLKEIYDKKIK